MPWQARRSDKTFRSLAIEAARAALQNAHLRRQDIDLVVYSIFSEVMLRQQIPTLMLQEYLGFQGGSSLRVEAGAATDGYALGAAFAQIRSGRSDVALVLGLQKTSDFYNFETKSREVGYWKGIANATDATWLQPVMPCSEAFLSTFVLNPSIAKYGAPTPEQLATVIPADATDVEITEASSRNEVFVTAGEPTDTLFKPTGKGLELVPVTHPNDLVVGEDATFRFLIDGKPAANLEVDVVPGGIRYRDQLNDRTLATDAKGEVKISWSEPGYYWINATATDKNATMSKATQRRMSYVTTVEVQAP